MELTSYPVPCIYPALAYSGCPAYTREHPLYITVPGSKSITNRALLLATLAEGSSLLKGVLFSDDSRHFLKCIQDLGFATEVNEAARIIRVTGHGGQVPLQEANQYVGSAGTAARFLTAYLGISHGTYHMDASEQMRKRPMAPLLASLQEMGCEITYEDREGCFPFTLKGHGFAADTISVNIEHSSQFLSALLIAACLSPKDMKIRVEGTHGMSYIRMTEEMMAQFGVQVTHPSDTVFAITKGQHYHALDYQVEPDVSAACYFYAMAAILNIPVCVENVHFNSLKGDVDFIRVLEQMGCRSEESERGIIVLPPADGRLRGIDVNMSACSDQAITLAAIAPFADSPTTIRGIGHIRHQESDRMNAIVTELAKMGILCRDTEHNLTIYPGTPKASVVDTYDDHRMAMGFSLIGLRVPGIVIDNPECCSKTFEDYFTVLDEMIDGLF